MKFGVPMIWPEQKISHDQL